MIQNSLIDYITAQKKAGISREAIASTLVGVGWQAADVEDTLKKIEGDAGQMAVRSSAGAVSVGQMVTKPAAQVSPVNSSSQAFGAKTSSVQPTNFTKPATENKPISGISPTFSNPKPTSTFPTSSGMSTSVSSGMARPSGSFGFPAADVIGGVNSPKASGAQPIRMADFMGGATSSPSASAGSPKLNVLSQARPSSDIGAVRAVPSGKKMGMIVEIVIIVVLAGLSVFLYMQNVSLNAKIANLAAPSGGASAQTSDLQNQVQTLTASQGTLQGQVGSLTAANTDLQTELSFLVAPAGTSATTTASGTIMGLLATSVSAKGAYSVRTPYNVLIYVKNGSNAQVAAMLKPLVNSSVTLAGAYVPGSDAIMVVSVNGNLVNPPAVATTTASTTPVAPSTTTATMSVTTSSTP